MTQPASPRQVLVVEDDRDMLDMLTHFLEDHGYRAIAARNGREAVDELRRGPRPGVILFDLVMPVMGGAQFRDVLRNDAELSTIPVILLSGARDAAAIASQLVVDAYLRKPLDREALLGILARLCP